MVDKRPEELLVCNVRAFSRRRELAFDQGVTKDYSGYIMMAVPCTVPCCTMPCTCFTCFARHVSPRMTKQESAQASRLSGIGVSLAGGGGHSLMVELKKIPPPGWGPKDREILPQILGQFLTVKKTVLIQWHRDG